MAGGGTFAVVLVENFKILSRERELDHSSDQKDTVSASRVFIVLRCRASNEGVQGCTFRAEPSRATSSRADIDSISRNSVTGISKYQGLF